MEPDEMIIKVMVDEGKVQKKDLIGVFKIHQANKAPLESLVVQLKVAKRQDVLDTKARVYNAPPYLIDMSKINMDVAKNIPQAMAKRYNLICLNNTADNRVLVAMHNPKDNFALEYVQMRTEKQPIPYVSLLADLEDAWEVIYASESKKLHPFFTKKATGQSEGPKKKVIPTKLSLPGLSSTSKVVVEDTEKTQSVIKEATEKIREKVKNDDDYGALVDSVQKEIDVLSILSHSATVLSSTTGEEKIITNILETAAKISNSQCGSILVLESGKPFLYFKEALGAKRDELLKVRIPMDEKSIAGWVAINRAPVAVNNIKEDPRHYKEVDRIIDFETRNLACVPMMWGNNILGVMELVNKEDGEFDEKDLEYLSILASQASVALYNAALLEKLHNSAGEIIDILLETLETIRPGLKEHSYEVAKITSAITKALNYSEEVKNSIYFASLIHDIGMIKTEKMEEHSQGSVDIVSKANIFQDIIPIVLHHHEYYDGSGYPDGLSGQSIPIGSRILSIAEGYLDGRAENPDLSDDEYEERFLSLFGKIYDPGLKFVFVSVLAELKEAKLEAESAEDSDSEKVDKGLESEESPVPAVSSVSEGKIEV